MLSPFDKRIDWCNTDILLLGYFDLLVLWLDAVPFTAYTADPSNVEGVYRVCGGDLLLELEDGTPSGWSTGTCDVGACQRKCLSSAMCSGFVWSPTSFACRWTSNGEGKSPDLRLKGDDVCYTQREGEGSTLDLMKWNDQPCSGYLLRGVCDIPLKMQPASRQSTNSSNGPSNIIRIDVSVYGDNDSMAPAAPAHGIPVGVLLRSSSKSGTSWAKYEIQDAFLRCMDGTIGNGWSCTGHGGRKRCPLGRFMCVAKRCNGGTEHCCEQDCDNAGGYYTPTIPTWAQHGYQMPSDDDIAAGTGTSMIYSRYETVSGSVPQPKDLATQWQCDHKQATFFELLLCCNQNSLV